MSHSILGTFNQRRFSPTCSFTAKITESVKGSAYYTASHCRWTHFIFSSLLINCPRSKLPTTKLC